ncbi:hypothetical protein BCV69DRAFT_210108 [Microstroma glucosiphilum]|uniref:Uncharacterized protein n=1 Tax=Pseudomicrostroma glucosiphilum TaxID=1684307 RepID=A0A316U5G5_9BASI|nr:hypothetical protein BCV69DRAFT_210108 [Pseudomicrostroma glucosiphilum]PWN20440.1 hypothetical protein BCV69DRAFT_210108 [Pseudomicrostroma glucosiphilum]
MPPPLLSLALVALILSACSSSFSGFLTASASFVLVYLSPPRPRKKVSFSDKRNEVYQIDSSDSGLDDDVVPPTSPIKDALAHVNPLWTSDDLLGRLTSIEEEDDEAQVDSKPYSISVEDYVPIAAMSLPPMEHSSSSLENNVIEAVREDHQNLTDNIGMSQSTSALPVSEQPPPLASVVATFAAATVTAATQVATSAAQEVAAASAAQASGQDEAPPQNEARREQSRNDGFFSLLSLAAAIHRDLVEERARARHNFIQPAHHLYNLAYRAQLRREAEAALSADRLINLARRLAAPVVPVPTLVVSPPTESERQAPVPPNTPTSATTATTVCGASHEETDVDVDEVDQSLEDLQPLRQDDTELDTSNVDLFSLPISRVEGHMDRRLSIFSCASMPARRAPPTFAPLSRVASDPLPMRSTTEEDVPISSAESLAETRAPYDNGVGLRTPVSPRRVGQRILPIHRPWASASSPALIPPFTPSDTALQSGASLPNQRPISLVHKRSFSDSHYNYVMAHHPDHVASLDSPPLPRCSTPPRAHYRDQSRSAPVSRRSTADSSSRAEHTVSGSGAARSASALGLTTTTPSNFSATFLSTPLEELESQINSALSDESFDESLRLAGYSWGIGTIPFLTGRDGTPGPAQAEAAGDGNDINSGMMHSSALGSQAFSDSPPLPSSPTATLIASSASLVQQTDPDFTPRIGSACGSSDSGSSASTTRPPRPSPLFSEVLECLGLPVEGTGDSGRLGERQRTLIPGSQLGNQSGDVAQHEEEQQCDLDLTSDLPVALEQSTPLLRSSSSFSSPTQSDNQTGKQKQKEGLALFSLSLPREGEDEMVTTPLPPPPALGRAQRARVDSGCSKVTAITNADADADANLIGLGIVIGREVEAAQDCKAGEEMTELRGECEGIPPQGSC